MTKIAFRHRGSPGMATPQHPAEPPHTPDTVRNRPRHGTNTLADRILPNPRHRIARRSRHRLFQSLLVSSLVNELSQREVLGHFLMYELLGLDGGQVEVGRAGAEQLYKGEAVAVELVL